MAFGSFDDGHADDGEAMSDINMTPLIDVMLVLLVIFILTAPLLTGALKLDLPKVAAPAAATQSKALAIAIRPNGQLYLDDQPITAAALAARMQQAARANPDTEVRISADTATPYGTVAQVLGAAQQAGLQRIGLITQPPAGNAPAAAR